MTKRRVVITGMGAVTPCGIGVDNFWNALLNGKSGVSLIESIDTEKHTVKIAGEIKDKDFNPEDYMSSKDANRMDRFTQFAMVAADEAIADSGIDEADIDPYRIGVLVSSVSLNSLLFTNSDVLLIILSKKTIINDTSTPSSNPQIRPRILLGKPKIKPVFKSLPTTPVTLAIIPKMALMIARVTA